MLLFLLQAAQHASQVASEPGAAEHVRMFLDSPAPYTPYSEYLVVMFLLWLLARRNHAHQQKKDFSAEAQSVLDAKYKKGEIDLKTYEKYRQELSLRLKKDVTA